MVFSQKQAVSGNRLDYNVYEMTFYEDFRLCLSKLDYIPEVSTKHVIALEKKIKELKDKLSEMANIKKDLEDTAIDKKLKELFSMLSDTH